MNYKGFLYKLQRFSLQNTNVAQEGLSRVSLKYCIPKWGRAMVEQHNIFSMITHSNGGGIGKKSGGYGILMLSVSVAKARKAGGN